MLNLYKLEIFTAVVEEGSFSKAADRLFMSQAAVSQHIHDLEAGLGITLFIRRPNGVQITESGQRLLDYTIKILGLVAAAESELTNVKKMAKGSLHIGAVPAAAAHFLTPWIKLFQQNYPNINLSLQHETSTSILHLLQDDMIDLGFVDEQAIPTPGVQSVSLPGTRIYLIVCKGHPWQERKSISIRELDRAPFVARPSRVHTRTWTNQFFAQYGITPTIVAEAEDSTEIITAVLRHQAAAFLPGYLAQPEINQGSLINLLIDEAPYLDRDLILLIPAKNSINPISKAFLEIFVQYFPKIHQLFGRSWLMVENHPEE